MISACEKFQNRSKALQLSADLQRQGIKPNIVTYNSLINACEQALCSSCKLYSSKLGGPWVASRCQAANKKILAKPARALLGAREALGGVPLISRC